ncbi:MAG TPA: glycosyltransferase family 39 protein [Terriglobales bacterium]|nr:glycosyltransferase family 39 protein [Terriglobales bacterium]
MTSRLRIPDWLLLLAFCGFFFLWKLSSFGLIGADEPRYAQVAREMLARHDWITPTLGGLPWLEKPPLFYWQAMIAYQIFGVSDWAARLPSVFDASLLVFAVFWLLKRLRPLCALDGALMLACSAGIVGYARAASMDMPLTATFAIAMLAWYAWFQSASSLYLAAFYCSIALALLAKGPVAPGLAGVIIVSFALVRRDWKIVWRTLWRPELLLFFLIGLPWYVLVQLRNPQFFRVFILEHNLARFSSNMFHHPEPFWYYIPVTLLGWVPWAVFVVAALVWTIRTFRKLDVDTLNIFLLIWVAVFVIFFSISESKLPGYVLPAIPPGIVLLAIYIHERAARKPHPLLVPLHAAVASALIFAALLLPSFVLQHRVHWSVSLVVPLALALSIGVALAVLLFRTGLAGLRIMTVVPAVITLALAIRLGAPALDISLSARPVSEALLRFAPGRLPVAVVLVPRETEFGLQFYCNQLKVARYELGEAPAGEHLVVAAQGFRNAFAKNVPGRNIVYLGRLPAQKLEFFEVGP